MNVIDLIYDFKKNDSSIWVQGHDLVLQVSEGFNSEALKKIVTEHKLPIVNFLSRNKIFVREDFLKKKIFKNDHSEVPLSFSQESLWFIEQYEGGTNAYHIPMVLELEPETDLEGMKYAIQQIVQRHEVLRSTIAQGENQFVIQRVHDKPLTFELVSVSESKIESILSDDVNRPFDLSTEYPIRAKFYRIANSVSLHRVVLLINIHHIATDGWSMDIFKRELVSYYESSMKKTPSFQLPPLPIQYTDYAYWQRKNFSDEVVQTPLKYWMQKLQGYQALMLPTDYNRPPKVDYHGGYKRFRIGEIVSNKLRLLSKDNLTTLHSLLLATINILLSKYTGQLDIITGSPAAGRQYGETEGVIGFFANMQVNRTILNQGESFRELIHQVHREQVEAQSYQDVPFEKIVQALEPNRDISRHPVFQVMFGVQSFENNITPGQQRYFKPYEGNTSFEVAKLDLSIYIDDMQEAFNGLISYATGLFNADTIDRFVSHYTYLLDCITTSPDSPYSDITLLSAEEYTKVVNQWNQTAMDYPSQKTVHELFNDQVKIAPKAIAAVYEGKALSYQSLNEKSNQLARYIRNQYKQIAGQELRPDTILPLYVEKGLDMIVGILAIMKAGAAYAPIDPKIPEERFQFILTEIDAKLILTQKSLINNALASFNKTILFIDVEEPLYDGESADSFHQYCITTNLAYVIYTSGTTGRPKGVMVEHRSLVNLIYGQRNQIEVTGECNVLQFSSLSFDASVWEIFTALLNGATLHVLPESSRKSGESLLKFMEANNISVALLPPVILNEMTPTELSALKILIVGGDVATTSLMRQWSSGRTVINAYGPTEYTVITSMHRFQAGDLNTNIGKPIANTLAYVLDANRMPVPVGVVGEFYIGGAGIARGYLNNQELTDERFVSNPFAGSDRGNKIYRTGDLVRWSPEGSLQFIGRSDDQIKIRGYRIETREIEHALTQIPGINQSYVVATEKDTDKSLMRYLVAYYTCDTDKIKIGESEIVERLSKYLPDYMLPSVFIHLGSFPVTVSGKIDRKALPQPLLSSGDDLRPSSDIEIAICKIWQETLQIDTIGLTDDFFRLGGNSILAVQISYAMSELMNGEITVADVFESRTIEGLMKKLVVTPNQLPRGEYEL